MRFLIALVLCVFFFSLSNGQYLRARTAPSSSSLAVSSMHPFDQWSLMNHLDMIDSMDKSPITEDLQDQDLLEQLMIMDNTKMNVNDLATIDDDNEFAIQQAGRRGFGGGGFGRGFGGFGRGGFGRGFGGFGRRGGFGWGRGGWGGWGSGFGGWGGFGRGFGRWGRGGFGWGGFGRGGFGRGFGWGGFGGGFGRWGGRGGFGRRF